MATIKNKMATHKAAEPRLTAKLFFDNLKSSASGAKNAQFFKKGDHTNKILGVRMASIFALARQFMQMPLEEIQHLLDNDYYEARIGAVSIMDFQARNKKVSPAKKRDLYDLYLWRHDRINNWDMVDRAAPYVVGGYLFDKSRAPLYKLARSTNTWERRTAIVSTYFFIRQNDIEDTFKIAEILVHDEHELINKAVGSWVREAGKRDEQRLFDFLDKYAATMPRITLRYAMEKLDGKMRKMYMTAVNKNLGHQVTTRNLP